VATLNVNEKAVLKLFPCLTPNPRGGDKWDASLCLNGIKYQAELKSKDVGEKLTWSSNKTDIDMLDCWEKERDLYLYSEYDKPNTPTLANEHYIMFRNPIIGAPLTAVRPPPLFPEIMGMRQQYEEWRRIIYRGEYKTKVCDLGLDKWLKLKKIALEEFKNDPDFSEWQEGLDRAEKKLTRINAKMKWEYIFGAGWRVRTCQDIKDAVAHQVKTYGSLK
jgi:hypothetical protein|tara:strand:+ start:194 stop:850 length:657 start_codon:yes stop_codon:yes gene_type:complete